MTAIQASWLAGFFDGEGSICKYKAGRNKAHDSWVLTISNTSYASLFFSKLITGVGAIHPKGKPKKKHHKKQWTWKVHAQRDILSILNQLLPYLIIKKKASDKFIKSFKEV